jgi:hypothetical protein
MEKSSKDRYEPKPLETYSPKTLANVRGLEDVIEDHCKTNSFPAC